MADRVPTSSICLLAREAISFQRIVTRQYMNQAQKRKVQKKTNDVTKVAPHLVIPPSFWRQESAMDGRKLGVVAELRVFLVRRICSLRKWPWIRGDQRALGSG